MDTIKIVLSCPGCGQDIWTCEDEKTLRCLSCGDEVDLQYMVPILQRVRRGYWENNGRCSCCEAFSVSHGADFCSNCGAEMDKENTN